MTAVYDVSNNDLYKINFHIREALECGDTVALVDGHYERWKALPGMTSLLNDPHVVFQLFEDVFERYPFEYVNQHINWNICADTLGFCLDYWQRTREYRKWGVREPL